MQSDLEERLITAALAVRLKAYAPYSGFKVGAALLGKSGRVYSGCNVENASYGATICAERAATVKAIAEGEQSFLALAVATASNPPSSPCGICRQFLSEFGDDLRVILVNENGRVIRGYLKDYLPESFSSGNLNKPENGCGGLDD